MAKDNSSDREGMIIGGGVLLGLGVGFLFLEKSALYFVGSLLIGLGLGLMISQAVTKK